MFRRVKHRLMVDDDFCPAVCEWRKEILRVSFKENSDRHTVGWVLTANGENTHIVLLNLQMRL